MKKRIKLLVIAIMACCLLMGCLEEEKSETKRTFSKDDTWTVYWYLCGSDLESQNGAATSDLAEMQEVTLPDNVRVIIQTGGASQWQNDVISADKIQRYEYKGNELKLLDEQELANMGDKDTFKDFLQYCNKNDKSDHKMLLFWNHGGGSITGAECDENFDGDALTLSEMKKAMSSVYGDKKPFELVGFDTCLMATLDTANTFKPYSNYLVASEETEPGNGWLYSGWMGQLGQHPEMTGKELGKAICDTFKEGCEQVGTQDTITLSVMDLNKIDGVNKAFDAMGQEILQNAYSAQEMCGKFARSAVKTENYGGNNKSDGYTNMVDLGDLVKNAKGILPNSSEGVTKALQQAVVYKIDSKYRKKSNGLSVYYCLNSDADEVEKFKKLSSSRAYSYFLDYSLGNELPEDAASVAGTSTDATETVTTFDGKISVYIKDEYAQFDLNKTQIQNIKTVTSDLTYLAEDGKTYISLGFDNDLERDFDKGHFKDGFSGQWAGLDGNIAYMQLIYECDEYNLYAVPIMLNGKECTMVVAYLYESEEYQILGAKKGLDVDTGMADKNLIEIKAGDKIAMVLYAGTLDSEDEAEPYAMDEFTFKKDSTFADMELDDGDYELFFRVEDTTGNVSYSSPVYVKMKNDNVKVSLD